MTTIAPFILALFLAALVRHVAARLFLHWIYPAVQLNARRAERAHERVTELDPSQFDYSVEYQRAYDDEGYTGRPVAVWTGGSFAMWLFTIAVCWVVSAHLGGPLAEPIWWLPWVYAGTKLLCAAPRLRQMVADMSGLGMGCALAVFGGVMLPALILYSIAPAGVTIFATIYWVVAWVAWRVFPYTKDDLPKVAMLFL